VAKGRPRADREQPVGLGRRLNLDPEPPGRPPHHTGSPTGSAAATTNNRWVSAGSPASCGGSCPRSAPTAPARRATNPPRSPPASPRGTPTTPADASRLRDNRSRTRSSNGTRTAEPAARAHHHHADPDHQPGNPVSSSLGSRVTTPARPLRKDAAPRTTAPAPRPDQATGVIDTHTRAALRHLGQQAQHRHPLKSIRRLPRTQSKCHPNAFCCGGRKPMQPIHHRRAQLLQRRERQAPSPTPHDARTTGTPARPQAQTPPRRLPTPLPETTSTRLCPPRAPQAAIQRLALVAPVVQHLRTPLGDHATPTIRRTSPTRRSSASRHQARRSTPSPVRDRRRAGRLERRGRRRRGVSRVAFDAGSGGALQGERSSLVASQTCVSARDDVAGRSRSPIFVLPSRGRRSR